MEEISLDWLLAQPAVRRGDPEVLAGAEHLGRTIRWMHIGEGSDISYYLKGGEVLITSGAGLGRNVHERRAYAERLVEAGVAGLILELRTVMEEVPVDFVRECERLGLPLVVLHEQVPFVEVTEEVHTAIVDTQTRILVERHRFSEHFADLLLDGVGAEGVLEDLSRLAVNPVLLVDADGNVLRFATHGLDRRDILGAYAGLRRTAPSGQATDAAPRAISSPVCGTNWPSGSSVVIVEMLSTITEVDDLMCREAARMVALSGLGKQDGGGLNRHDVIADLLRGDIDESYAVMQLARLKFDASLFVPLMILRTESGHPMGTLQLDVAWREFVSGLDRGLRQHNIKALTSIGTPGRVFAVLGMDHEEARAETVRRAYEIATAAARTLLETSGGTLVAAYGPFSRTWRGLGVGLRECDALAPYLVRGPREGVYDVNSPDLDRLIWLYRDDSRLLDFVRSRLAPLDELDAKRNGNLVQTLAAFCASGGRKAETARALHLERPSLYDRLGRIERALNVSLNDPDVMLGLHLALKARSITDQ